MHAEERWAGKAVIILSSTAQTAYIERVERIVHKSQSFEEADAWNASQHRAMSPNERMRAAKEIRDRVFPGQNPDIREWQAIDVRFSVPEKLRVAKRELAMRPQPRYHAMVEKEFAVFHSFEDAERADRAYYRSLTPSERVDILLELISRWQNDETAKGFERVYRIAKLHED